jgi:hypothetical protein
LSPQAGSSSYDRKVRAFDKDTGKLLWEKTMVNSGNGTPATYEVNGRQYVIIPAFGGKEGGPRGAARQAAGGAGAPQPPAPAVAAAGTPPAAGGGRGAAQATGLDIGTGPPTGGAFVVFALPETPTGRPR